MRVLRVQAQLVLCMMAMTGLPQIMSARSLRRQVLTTLRRISGGLGARPPNVNLAGLKS